MQIPISNFFPFNRTLIMNFNKQSYQEARRIDLVEYLAQLGHHPRYIRGYKHWYISPLREEKTPSFKVDKALNLWFDHGIGKGGNFIDFGILYHHCTVQELLERIPHSKTDPPFSLQPPLALGLAGAGEKEKSSGGKIVILDARPLSAQPLIDYLQSRKIPLEIATRSCKEVDFTLYGKRQTVIGFGNRAGGYELRSEHFKGSSSPKDITFFDNRTEDIAVFEGFFNYLSFQTINRNGQAPLTNCLVLNSLAFLEKSRPLMEQYSRIHLILDRDPAGRNFTAKALEWDRDRYGVPHS
jgi:Toprim domain-containing protein